MILIEYMKDVKKAFLPQNILLTALYQRQTFYNERII